MRSFLNLDDNVRLETRGNVCAIKNLSTNSFHLKKHFADSQFKTIEIFRDLFECIYIHLKNSASDSFEEISSSSSDDSYSEDSEVTRDESRQVR